MSYPLLFLFALTPSLIWLSFYLRKDRHPEPNRMVIKIFLFGALITIPAIFVENSLEGFLSSFFDPKTFIFLALYYVFAVALVEELLKYIVVRMGALSDSALDEPLDVMLYMVISALGFAALENILLIFKLIADHSLPDIFFVNILRFGEAILLHALMSALWGYFIILSQKHENKRRLFFWSGLAIAVILHGLFDVYITTLGSLGIFQLLLPLFPLAILGLIISYLFQQVRSQKGLCTTS